MLNFLLGAIAGGAAMYFAKDQVLAVLSTLKTWLINVGK
jgi:hypothetical protein